MKKLFLIASVVVAGLFASANPAAAADLLTNPGFELDQSQTLTGWTSYGPNGYNETGAPAHSGTNYYKVYQAFNGAVNYTGIYQDYISGPGATYSADGWAYTASTDTLAGQNAAWIEVTFRDANANVLALYRSSSITTNVIASGMFPKSTWVDLPVTNQFDPGTYALTNTVTTLVAPAGTYFVQYQIVFQGDAAYSGGSVYFDDLNLQQAGGSPYGNWNLTWSDEFNGTSINSSVWTYDTGAGGWGNSELEDYTTTNAYVSGGVLHIVARQTTPGATTYTSARMKTEGLVSWKYGRFEWRAQLPTGAGFWPALWLLGTNIAPPGPGWPLCGEIDVMENKGSALTNVQGSLHTSGSNPTAVYTLPGNGSVTNFHTYTLDWATNSLIWYVDGHLYEMQTSWVNGTNAYPSPLNAPFFIIMNVAVGGQYLGYPTPATINANSTFPGDMQVDYVRIFNQTAPLTISAARTGKTITLSWPTDIVCHPQAEFGSLNAGWTDLSGSPNPLVVTPTNTATFYRLASP
jgi:beta-glucanase (GH16 family)